MRQGIREGPNIRNRFKFAGSLSRTIKSLVCKINWTSNHASNSHLSQTIHSAGHLVHALLHAAVLSVDSCSLRETLRKAKQCAWCQTTETTYLRRTEHCGRACPICSYMSHLSITVIMPCLGACLTCKLQSRWKVIYHRCPPSGEGNISYNMKQCQGSERKCRNKITTTEQSKEIRSRKITKTLTLTSERPTSRHEGGWGGWFWGAESVKVN